MKKKTDKIRRILFLVGMILLGCLFFEDCGIKDLDKKGAWHIWRSDMTGILLSFHPIEWHVHKETIWMNEWSRLRIHSSRSGI